MQTDISTIGPRDLVHALTATVIKDERYAIRQIICRADDTLSAVEELLAEDAVSIAILGRSVHPNRAKKLLAVDYAQFVATAGDAPPFRAESSGRLRALVALKKGLRSRDPLIFFTRNTTEATLRIATLLVDEKRSSIKIVARSNDTRSIFADSLAFFSRAIARDEAALDGAVIKTK